jgi:2-amino-4-hydroxy-6-hydroxymethyldihydropteridine diphosphokinase
LNNVAIALGSNVGDRHAHLSYAADRLNTFLTNLRVSRWYDTAPVGVAPQPDFLNGAAVGVTTLTPREVLDALLSFERERGRARPFEGAPRTLDLDLVLYDLEVMDEPGLLVPHPRFRERVFVLEPLAEIAGDWVDPVTRRTVAELWRELRARQRP